MGLLRKARVALLLYGLAKRSITGHNLLKLHTALNG
jgi:hypothetical protein